MSSPFSLSADADAQFAHAGWGGFLVCAFALFHHPLWGAGAALAWASLKEFYLDPFLNHDPWDQNFKDLLFWIIGMGSGLVLTFLAGATAWLAGGIC